MQGDDVEGDEVENDDVEEEEDDDTEDADVEEEDRSQDRAARFARAGAVEMHFNVSQEPLYTEIRRPLPSEGERVRGGLTSNKMPEGAKSLCRTKAGSRRTRAGWQLAVQKRRKSQGLELVSSRFRK